MKKILSCDACLTSALKLRDVIETKTSKKFLVSKQASNINEDGCLLRYGNGMPINRGYQDTEFNPPGFIEMCANKLTTSGVLQNLGVFTPAFHTQDIPEQFPVLIRTTLRGSGGDGIIPIDSAEEFNRHWQEGMFWTPYHVTGYEVRAYVAGGKITHTYYKTPFENQEGDNIRIRSEYHFSYTNPEGRFKKLRRIISRIVDATAGKFFSVDAGWIPESNDYITFELNSGSWMNNSITNALADFLIEQLPAEFGRPE